MATPPLSRTRTKDFSEEEITGFEAKAAKRDEEGRGWDSLFVSGDHITLPLATEGEALGLDKRLDAILTAHNEHATKAFEAANAKGESIKPEPKYCTFTRHTGDKTLLKRSFGGKPTNRDTNLIQFLQSKDDAECHLLAHDMTVEWGKAKDAPTEKAEAGKLRDFALLKNTKPLAADQFGPDALRVVISRDPVDIARMSTGRRWTSCMGKGGVNYNYVPKEIEAGTLVAYLVHQDDQNIDYPLARVLLKPFHNDKGETILVPNHVYASKHAGNSQMESALLATVRSFVRNEVSHGKTGQFTMAKEIYSDGQETSVTLGKTIDPAELGAAIAGSIRGKVIEYLTEIEVAHNAGNEAHKKLHIKKLHDIYAAPEVATMGYLRNLRDANIGLMLPKPSEVKAAMKSPEMNKARTSLYLHNRGFGPEVAKVLAANTTLTSLHLWGNNIGDEGAKALAANKTLSTLDVSCNKIGEQGARALAANTTLTSLDLGNNKIGDEGAIALAANKTLSTLDMSENKIGDEGAKALAANKTLSTLNLKFNAIGDEVAKVLAANTTLTSLNLEFNKIGDEGAKALAANKTLSRLNLRFSNIGDEGAKTLEIGLKNNKNLLFYGHYKNDNELQHHLQDNLARAKHYMAQFTAIENPVFTKEDKTEIQSRANAIRHVLDVNQELSAEQKQTALKNLEAVVKPHSWVDRTAQREPRKLG
jgi:hypothetical protein